MIEYELMDSSDRYLSDGRGGRGGGARGRGRRQHVAHLAALVDLLHALAALLVDLGLLAHHVLEDLLLERTDVGDAGVLLQGCSDATIRVRDASWRCSSLDAARTLAKVRVLSSLSTLLAMSLSNLTLLLVLELERDALACLLYMLRGR